MAKDITAVRKNGDGDIQEVQFNDGTTASIEQAIQMAENGLINNVNTGATRGENSHKTLRSDPDGDPSNNLDNLPSF